MVKHQRDSVRKKMMIDTTFIANTKPHGPSMFAKLPNTKAQPWSAKRYSYQSL